METRPDTRDKAARINADPSRYGTFAEIGAGQEVARHFFLVGHAARTVAKSMSAYDMTFSDAIYGPTDRYVSRQRLRAMLDYEFGLLVDRLGTKRGDATGFFVFADTVAKASTARDEDGRAWLGVRFQHVPLAEPSEVILHARLLERDPVREQETLGVLGINLLHGALYDHADPAALIASLMDDLRRDGLELDLIRFDGPAFAGVDNRLMALQLVERGYTDAALFTAEGEVVQAAEVLWGRPVLVERGSFRPVTLATVDMLERTREAFGAALGPERVPVTLLEMTLHNLSQGAGLRHDDFLARVDVLGALGCPVMVSDFDLFRRLATYLRRYTREPLAFALGVPSVRHIFDERWYADLEGGILEGLGRLFKTGLTLHVYPLRDPVTAMVATADTLEVAPHLQALYRWCLDTGRIVPLRDVDKRVLHIFPAEVLDRMQRGDPSWEAMVPRAVVERMKTHPYYRG